MFSAAKNFPNKFFFSIFNIPGDELFIEKGTLKRIIQIFVFLDKLGRISIYSQFSRSVTVRGSDTNIVIVGPTKV